MKKAQLSSEMFFAIGIVLMIFLALMMIYFDKMYDVNSTKNYLEKKKECEKIANVLSNLYAAKPGTTANINTKYLVSLNNNIKQVVVEEIESVQTNDLVIAYVSQKGTESQAFLSEAFQSLNPDRYCTDLYSGTTNQVEQGCDGYPSLRELINNLDKYNVIYMEDPHILRANYDTVWGALEGWLNNGTNVLALSEHFVNYCESATTWCWFSRINEENVLGVTWHYDGYNNGDEWAEVVQEDERYNLNLGDRLLFDEIPYVTELASTNVTTEVPIMETLYGKSNVDGGSLSSLQSSDNSYYWFGFKNQRRNKAKQAWLNLTFNISSEDVDRAAVFKLEFCHSGDTSKPKCDRNDGIESGPVGAQDVEVFNFNTGAWDDIGDMSVTNTWYGDETKNEQWSIGSLSDYVDNGKVVVRVEANFVGESKNNKDDAVLLIDYARLEIQQDEQQSTFNVIVQYEGRSGEAAMAYWEHSNGVITFFSDFDTVLENSTLGFDEIVVEHLKKLHTIINPKMESDITCPFYGEVDNAYRVTGNLTFVNLGETLQVQNETL